MLATFLITGALYGFSAWTEWWARIQLYNRDLGVNEVNLRMLVAGVDHLSPALMRQRLPLYVLVQITAVVLVVLAARDRPLEEALVLGLPLIFVLLHPVNYHGHFVFLLMLLGARQGLLVTAAPLLVMCLGGYWAGLDPDAVRRFELMSVLLFAALAWLFFVQLRLNRAPAPDVR
jgi:FtsH-binding integral membrane protein